MNKLILMGRLTRDPEIRYAQNQDSTAVARFSLAVDRRFKREGEQNADFFNCVAFGKQAEFCEKYLSRGIKMVVTGRLENNNYTAKDGSKVYGVQVMVEELEFAESKNAQTSASAGNGNNSSTGMPSTSGDGFINIDDIEDELPF